MVHMQAGRGRATLGQSAGARMLLWFGGLSAPLTAESASAG
jgi:hypothetical protein